jgi:hypothetical protein
MSSNNVLSRRNTAKISNQINEQKPSSFKNVLNIHIENPSTIHGRRKSSTMKLHQEMQQEPLKDEKEKEKEILSLHEILDKTPDTRNQKGKTGCSI